MNRVPPLTYRNPVYARRPCADPFVLKYLNEYWCYSTGIAPDGRCFAILHSRDLVNWREAGAAMERLNEEATCYWAPEVTYDNGHFLMYYSVGNEERMQIRVAVAHHPAGPFVDAGRRLTTEAFAIDPHVFCDDDGKRYLFYATDFLEHTHIGTGTVCDEMLDAFTLAGKPRVVTRARFDWQVYDPQRREKGGVRWHTVEGPFVLKRKGVYYQMFSGGNWQTPTYGASYAVSYSMLWEDEWRQVADGERVLPILRTIPGAVIGPGHNSATRGINNVERYCVYHLWHELADGRRDRVLAIDRLDWAGERLLVLGATTTPQAAPSAAAVCDYFETPPSAPHAGLGDGWRCAGGKWARQNGAALQEVDQGVALARCRLRAPHFIVEVSARGLADAQPQGVFGVVLLGDEAGDEAYAANPAAQARSAVLRFCLSPARREAAVEWRAAEAEKGAWQREKRRLPEHFNFSAYHLLRVEVNGLFARLVLDDTLLDWQGLLLQQAQSLALYTEDAAAAFAGFALTRGWEDLFTAPYTSPSALHWDAAPADDRWLIDEQQLWHADPRQTGSVLTKAALAGDYEFVANVKLASEAAPCVERGQGYGFLPALDAEGGGALLMVCREGAGWALVCERTPSPQRFWLPADFEPFAYQQFRFRKTASRLTIHHEAQLLGEIAAPAAAARVGLYSSGVKSAFEMLRVTAI